MIQLMLYSFLIMFSFIFIQMNHPLAMGLMLLIKTILICLISGMMSKSFWFSYILFLVFLGGMLVLFIYVTSLASNEMFSMSMKLMLNSIMIMMTMFMLIMLIDKTSLMQLWNNDMQSITNMYSFMTENSLNLNKLYNYPTNLITLLLINYLLITLIAIVKITKLSKGPLRMQQ